MKRYLVFSWMQYGPCGGWNDYVESFSTVEEAKTALPEIEKRYHSDESQIVDLETLQIVV